VPPLYALVLWSSLPVATAAPTTTVTVHTAGLAVFETDAILGLGMNFGDAEDGPLSYEMTTSATFTPRDKSYFDYGKQVEDWGSSIRIHFRLGDKTFDFDGAGFAIVRADAGHYIQQIGFSYGSYHYSITSRVVGASPFGDRPLTPDTVDIVTDSYSGLWLDAYPSNPDNPGSWSLTGRVGVSSLAVSPVPEPGMTGLLSAGLLIMAAGRVRRPRS
jgi:hypothetical protein